MSGLAIPSVRATFVDADRLFVEWTYVVDSSCVNTTTTSLRPQPCAIPFELWLVVVTDESTNTTFTTLPNTTVTTLVSFQPRVAIQTASAPISLPRRPPRNHTFLAVQVRFANATKTDDLPTCPWFHLASHPTTSCSNRSTLSSSSSLVEWTTTAPLPDPSLDVAALPPGFFFLGIAAVLALVFVVRLLVFRVFLKAHGLDTFDVDDGDDSDDDDDNPKRMAAVVAAQKAKAAKKWTSTSKRAKNLVDFAKTAQGTTLAPHVAMQVKLYSGEYHPAVEEMVKTVMDMDKKKHIAAKHAQRAATRAADLRGADLSEEEQALARHQLMTMALLEGAAFVVLKAKKATPVKRSKMTRVYADKRLTSLKWNVGGKPKPKAFEKPSGHMLRFADITAVDAFTQALPNEFVEKNHAWLERVVVSSKKSNPSKRTNDNDDDDKEDEADQFHAVLIQYKHAAKPEKTKSLLLKCKNERQQAQVVASVQIYAEKAKKRLLHPAETVAAARETQAKSANDEWNRQNGDDAMAEATDSEVARSSAEPDSTASDAPPQDDELAGSVKEAE
ncbi:Aste57867_25550 [Aphanomyces stellatus]|uniref:Aste57867_25550 protein n=1 Tax=Aphanomyces stellatus TaxID=120398 RepID=A0A485LUR7_9STRA|nr:hypothetical protein As57867_025471 [Aphanomyces stellatus]VFU02173.1 Aste57867_25550 [Aphanomyces stellatus]